MRKNRALLNQPKLHKGAELLPMYQRINRIDDVPIDVFEDNQRWLQRLVMKIIISLLPYVVNHSLNNHHSQVSRSCRARGCSPVDKLCPISE